MAAGVRTRHEMYSGLEEKLGTKVADALMAHLPPVGWADVATKQDIGAVNARLDELHRLTLWLFSTQLALVGLVFTIAKLT